MIAKHVAVKAAHIGNFAGLMRYISDSQDKRDRVGEIRVTNCESNRLETAVLEILNTQDLNKRTGTDKSYHLVVSFAPGESPARTVLEAIEQRICAALGFGSHQRISVAHHDTDNLHLHIAINKIHPQRYTTHEPFNAYHTLGKICSKLEREFGLQQVNHTARKARGENGADDMERHTDVESLLGWIKRECKGPMQSAKDWTAVHAVMRAHGLTIHERANGLVISSDDGISVKASSVAREFSKAGLEKKLGAFEPPASRDAARDVSTHYAKRPLRSGVDTSELYARYKEAQQQGKVSRADEWTKARERKTQQIEAVKRKGRLKRAAIKLLNMPGVEKRLLYAVTSKTLLKEIEAINNDYLQARQEIYERYARRSWADWLRDEARTGDEDALMAMRARPSASGLKGNTIYGAGNNTATRANVRPDNVTKNGTFIYHVGASAVRDDGSKLKVSRCADRDGLEAALRMAIERYGNCITVTGSAQFKEQIARVAAAAQLPVRFDDAALERRRRQLTQPLKAKENKYDNHSRSNDANVGRRPDRSGNGRGEQTIAGHAAFAARPGTGRPHGGQPYPGGARRPAPPAGTNRLRGLPELGLVYIADRSEVLLPRNVSGHVEHQGTKPDHGVRRRVRRPGRLKQAANKAIRVQLKRSRPPPTINRQQAAPTVGSAQPKPRFLRNAHPRAATLSTLASRVTKPNVGKAGSAPPPSSKDRLRELSKVGDVAIGNRSPLNVQTPLAQATQPQGSATPARQIADYGALLRAARAAEKYVIEREQKRSNGFDIPKHSLYNFAKEMSAVFGGLRRIDGQPLALLKISEEIFVRAVDESTARNLKRLALGQPIVVKAHGAIKTKGRSR